MTRRIDKPDTDTDIQIRHCLDHSISFVVVSGAGSGKTTSLVKALDHIRKTQGQCLQQRGQRVACITYTEVAEKEIWGDVGQDPLFHVSTIHSFLWTLVKPFQADIKIWVSQRIEEKLADLREKRENFGPRVQQKTRDKNQHDIERYEVQLKNINTVKRFKYETGSDYLNGILGHDDIIKMGPALIQEHPLLRTILARKYPFFFVDESQDTFPEVVEALKVVDSQMGYRFCLGFFGDPMQQIYYTGIGKIDRNSDWADDIKKRENFRCPTRVLSVINNIRRQGDGLVQIDGRQLDSETDPRIVDGTARLFILPADEHKNENLSRIREFLAWENKDELWNSDGKEAAVKVLVIVHRMAAERLGFGRLYSALNDDAPESFRNGFREGTFWALQPFQTFLLPLIEAFNENRQFEVLTLMRTHSPRLSDESVKNLSDPAELLLSVKENILKLAGLLAHDGNASILDVLHFVNEAKLIRFDERFNDLLSNKDIRNTEDLGSTSFSEEGEELQKAKQSMIDYFNCPSNQLWGYQTYVNDESPFSTQQGIKGAEFDRVLVVLDDQEGRHNQFSYDKLLGIQPPSSTDEKNLSEGKDTVMDRTRRLFYVCCSRAVRDLAVVFFASEVELALTKFKESEIFEDEAIHTIEDLFSDTATTSF